MVGFVNIGDVNNQLLQLQREWTSNSNGQPPLATHMLTFMVRGLLSDLSLHMHSLHHPQCLVIRCTH